MAEEPTEGRHKDYFEGILQLRNPTKEVINFARGRIKRDKLVFIAREETVVNGKDIYVSSQKFMQIIGRELQKKFGGEYKISRKQFSVNKNTSKMVYRINVLFRIPNFKVGDVVKARGRFIKITKLENKVFGNDVDSGKKISMDYKYVK